MIKATLKVLKCLLKRDITPSYHYFGVCELLEILLEYLPIVVEIESSPAVLKGLCSWIDKLL
jgi:hypothetical protein